MSLIEADALKETFDPEHYYDWYTPSILENIDNAPTVDAVPLSEIYRLIEGHSNYRGDSILAALTCVAEGKNVKPIKPVDAVPVVHAKWILAFSEEENVWKCSVCDKYWLLNNGTPFDNGMNFCPKCGARMDLR